MQRYERGILLIKRREILRLANGRFEIAVGLAVMHGRPPAFALQDQLYAPRLRCTWLMRAIVPVYRVRLA